VNVWNPPIAAIQTGAATAAARSAGSRAIAFGICGDRGPLIATIVNRQDANGFVGSIKARGTGAAIHVLAPWRFN
jgi:hypothetical protein